LLVGPSLFDDNTSILVSSNTPTNEALRGHSIG
jgi:hypothetical protein